MKRKIIKINEDLCNGCGLCAEGCHEGAIGMIDGKAKLLRDDYCDGLGDCLPICPTGAISFEVREAAAYDEETVKANMLKNKKATHIGGCPGKNVKIIDRTPESQNIPKQEIPSHLVQWPVQIKLVPINAPYFNDANLLISADCTAFSYGDFHEKFIKDHITLIGCPKLDEGDYSEKLAEIIKSNNIKSVTVVHMEVPCCSGLSNAVSKALQNSKKDISLKTIIISTDGKILK